MSVIRNIPDVSIGFQSLLKEKSSSNQKKGETTGRHYLVLTEVTAGNSKEIYVGTTTDKNLATSLDKINKTMTEMLQQKDVELEDKRAILNMYKRVVVSGYEKRVVQHDKLGWLSRVIRLLFGFNPHSMLSEVHTNFATFKQTIPLTKEEVKAALSKALSTHSPHRNFSLDTAHTASVEIDRLRNVPAAEKKKLEQLATQLKEAIKQESKPSKTKLARPEYKKPVINCEVPSEPNSPKVGSAQDRIIQALKDAGSQLDFDHIKPGDFAREIAKLKDQWDASTFQRIKEDLQEYRDTPKKKI